jgi:hypothetical protein
MSTKKHNASKWLKSHSKSQSAGVRNIIHRLDRKSFGALALFMMRRNVRGKAKTKTGGSHA